jgi:hypothetical protein
MKYLFIPCLFAGALACARSPVQYIEPASVPVGLVTLSGATNVRANTQRDSTVWLRYTLSATYPPTGALQELSDRLSHLGWAPQTSLFDPSAPSTPQTAPSWSLLQAEHSEATEAVTGLTWHDSSGNLVSYELRHALTFMDPKEPLRAQQSTPLQVRALYVPAGGGPKPPRGDPASRTVGP